MKSHATKTFSDSIVIFPDDLKYFDSFLRKTFAKVDYKADCEDETKLKPDSLSELLEYENPDFKRISSITINALTEQILGDSVEIIVGTCGLFSNNTGLVNFKFEDNNQQYAVEAEILKRIKAMRPWYFWINKLSFKLILPVFLMSLPLILISIDVFKKIFGYVSLPSTTPVKTTFTESETFVIFLGILGILFLVGFLIDRSRDYLFPKCFFTIGRQEKEYKKRRNIAYFVFGVVIVGIAINIVSSIIYSLK